MKLNAEQIKKALECCASGTSAVACDGCPLRYEEGTCDDDSNYLLRQALALIISQEQRIKELEVELKAMRGAANSYKMHITELTQAHEMLSESYDHLEKTKDELLAERSRLTEELQKLKKVKYIFSTVDYCADDLAKALEENKRLTEENERILTALANYDRQTDVRIAENYYTVEAYEELREENESLHTSCTELAQKCASLNEENERLKKDNEYVLMQHAFQRRPSDDCWNDVIEKTKADTVKKMQERLIAEFRKDDRMNYYIRMTLDQIAKEMLEGEKCKT